MDFPDPLLRGRLSRRYKRFLADVVLEDGTAVTAHCPNPGAMLGLATPGAEVWLSPARNPARKLAYTLEMVRVVGNGEHGLVGVNTGRANAVALEGIADGRVPELAGYEAIRREVAYGGNSRIDLLLESADRPPCYVEIKSVTLKRDAAIPGTAEFPDSVTARGTKHLEALGAMVAEGARAVMLFLVQRGDCARFAVAGDIDPTYAGALDYARAAGVETLCYACTLSADGVTLDKGLPVLP